MDTELVAKLNALMSGYAPGGVEVGQSLNSQVLEALYPAGDWNAEKNEPHLKSRVGPPGAVYTVIVAGNTPLDGQSGWEIGDYAIFNPVTVRWLRLHGTTGQLMTASAMPSTVRQGTGDKSDVAPIINGRLVLDLTKGAFFRTALTEPIYFLDITGLPNGAGSKRVYLETVGVGINVSEVPRPPVTPIILPETDGEEVQSATEPAEPRRTRRQRLADAAPPQETVEPGSHDWVNLNWVDGVPIPSFETGRRDLYAFDWVAADGVWKVSRISENYTTG